MMDRGTTTVDVIGVPLDLGANMRGANMGPAAIRIAALHDKLRYLGYAVRELGDLHVPLRESIGQEVTSQRYLPAIAQVCERLCEATEASVKRGHIPLTIGGDHCIAIGSISGVSKAMADRGERLGLIWVDAHADLNTPEASPTGNIHGMPLATLLDMGHPRLRRIGGEGAKIRPTNVVLLGIRAIDDIERKLCRESGVRYYTMREIDERGMPAIMEEAVRYATDGTAGVHVSFDMDAIEPLYAPGVSTPVTGGLSYREAHLCLEYLAERTKVVGMDFVELNPMTDVDHKTAKATVELVQSLLGKSII